MTDDTFPTCADVLPMTDLQINRNMVNPEKMPTANVRIGPSLQTITSDANIDVRLWARHYVAMLLEFEGVSITPTTISEAS
jgi:hypothetical protein